jgi:hypothetical protein
MFSEGVDDPHYKEQIESCANDIRAILDGNFTYSDGSAPENAEEACHVLAARAAFIASMLTNVSPGMIMGAWAGHLVETEAELYAQRIHQYQEFKAEQARNN